MCCSSLKICSGCDSLEQTEDSNSFPEEHGFLHPRWISCPSWRLAFQPIFFDSYYSAYMTLTKQNPAFAKRQFNENQSLTVAGSKSASNYCNCEALETASCWFLSYFY